MKKVLVRIAFVTFAVIATGVMNTAYCEEMAAQQATGSFTVARLVIGTGVENKEPVGVSESLPVSTEKAYCFLEVTNIAEDTHATFAWYMGDKEMSKVNVPVKKGPKWRTYSNKTLYGLKGDWKVDLQDASGNILKTVQFKVE